VTRKEEFEHVMNLFPDSPRSIMLKTDLLRRGVVVTDDARRRCAVRGESTGENPLK